MMVIDEPKPDDAKSLFCLQSLLSALILLYIPIPREVEETLYEFVSLLMAKCFWISVNKLHLVLSTYALSCSDFEIKFFEGHN